MGLLEGRGLGPGCGNSTERERVLNRVGSGGDTWAVTWDWDHVTSKFPNLTITDAYLTMLCPSSVPIFYPPTPLLSANSSLPHFFTLWLKTIYLFFFYFFGRNSLFHFKVWHCNKYDYSMIIDKWRMVN